MLRHVRRLAHAPQHALGVGYVPVWFWAVWDRAKETDRQKIVDIANTIVGKPK